MLRCLIVLLAFVVSGCQHDVKNYQYYMIHPETIKPAYEQCMTFSEEERSEHTECTVVLRAEKDFGLLIQTFISNQHAFGQRILGAEQQLAASTTALTKLRQEKAERSAIDAAQEKQAIQRDALARLLAVIRVVGEE